MRKAILPLLIIITIALSASVASATDFSATGLIAAPGWTTTGDWQQTIEDGAFTESVATASHPVVTGASGAFDLTGKFRITDLRNEVRIGLKAGGHEYAIEYKNNKFWFNNVAMGSFPGGLAATSTFYPHIYSTDGITWHAAIYTYTADVAVTAPPTELTLGLKDNTGSLAASPVFFIPLVFESAGESAPVIDPTPTPTPEVLPVSTEPVYDVQQVQDYYNNIYPLLYGPQANYGMTGNATPAAATSFKVSGAVTSAADGSPIAGASVVLGEAKQTTDSLGAFKFEGITTGNNDIAVSADGFASKTQSVNVNADLTQNFALDKVATGGSTVASAANETTNVTTNVTTTTTNTTTNVTTPANTTVAPTTAPSATQTKSPGFEGIIAAIAMIGAAGVLVYVNRKH